MMNENEYLARLRVHARMKSKDWEACMERHMQHVTRAARIYIENANTPQMGDVVSANLGGLAAFLTIMDSRDSRAFCMALNHLIEAIENQRRLEIQDGWTSKDPRS